METLEQKKARLRSARIARDASLAPLLPKPNAAALRDAKAVRAVGKQLRALARVDPQLACEAMMIMLGVKSVDIIREVPYKKASTTENA